ncbi:MAG: 4-hydroxythreonine-4-phosphate dehydrogenase PdxA [Myxococcaceae bacterium]
MKPTIGISLGDVSGIGPEVLARALTRPEVRRALHPVVFGDGPTMAAFPVLARLPLCVPQAILRGAPARIVVTSLPKHARLAGKPTRLGGQAQLAFVDAAIDAALAGKLDALCTGPVSKEAISRAGTPFMGHTEFLAQRFGVDVLMLMDGPKLRVALATNHVALKEVPRSLSRARLLQQLELLDRTFRRGGHKPKIGVLALNPHAGEGGLLGQEEQRIIAPAIAAARRRGIACEGPLPADGVFARAGRGELPFDAVLAMYHDQALGPAKALDFERTVNVTLGLPLPRTSPDHGVAYSLAGTGKASAEPMVQALLRAAAYSRAGVKKKFNDVRS